MQNFNYHSHTKRCEHAIGEDEEYVKAAIANGFQVMALVIMRHMQVFIHRESVWIRKHWKAISPV